jgi:prepilin-type N-terminal cleavage/methylation domain-containing protein
MSIRSLKAGFTLIELLLVIGIIAILAAIVIVAINPTKQLGDARNAQRRSDVNTVLNAVYQYSIDNNGNLPSAITTTATAICQSTPAAVCTGLINLSVLTGAYLVALPVDPQEAGANSTNYTIVRTNGRITVAAPGAEQGATISVTR